MQKSKDVKDYSADNFAIVFAAMGVGTLSVFLCTCTRVCACKCGCVSVVMCVNWPF